MSKTLLAKILTASLLLFTAASCRKRPVSVPPNPTVSNFPNSKPATDVVATPAPDVVAPLRPDPAQLTRIRFQQASEFFQQGRYSEASQLSDVILLEDPSYSAQADSLFLLAMIYAVADNPTRDMDKAADLLDRLLVKYPDSTHYKEARLILDLAVKTAALEREKKEKEEKIKQLDKQLRQLKEIDLQRRPTRPPP